SISPVRRANLQLLCSPGPGINSAGTRKNLCPRLRLDGNSKIRLHLDADLHAALSGAVSRLRAAFHTHARLSALCDAAWRIAVRRGLGPRLLCRDPCDCLRGYRFLCRSLLINGSYYFGIYRHAILHRHGFVSRLGPLIHLRPFSLISRLLPFSHRPRHYWRGGRHSHSTVHTPPCPPPTGR